MSTLTTYRAILSEELGTAETASATQTKRDRAINQACRWVGNNYDVPELQIEVDTTFTSGLATIPTRFLRNERMYDSTSLTPYPQLTREQYAQSVRGFTIGYSVTASARRVKINPTTTTSARWSYFQKPLNLSDASDDSGLPAELDKAVGLLAAAFIKRQKGNYDESEVLIEEAKEEIRLWSNTFQDSTPTIRSAFAGLDYLNS